MRIAETLHMSVKEVMQLDILEIRLWYEWFSLQTERQKETMNRGTTGHRSKGSR